MTRTCNLPQVLLNCTVELPHRHRAGELRLDATVAAHEERPGLRGQVPLLVPGVVALVRVVAGVDLDVDEPDVRAGEPLPRSIDDVDDRSAGSARAPARRGE